MAQGRYSPKGRESAKHLLKSAPPFNSSSKKLIQETHSRSSNRKSSQQEVTQEGD